MKKLHIIALVMVTVAITFPLSSHKAKTEEHKITDIGITTIAEAQKPPSSEPAAPIVDSHAAKAQTHQEAAQAPQKVADEHVAAEPTKAAPVAPPQVSCGPQDPKIIYDILISIGVPRLSAIQQIGSWQHESELDPCQKVGDNGVAWGLNSWHPGRRADMPAGLRDQVIWAITVEMPRDCRKCYDQFMAGQSVWSVRQAIKSSTRWGIEGKRWHYADNFSGIL